MIRLRLFGQWFRWLIVLATLIVSQRLASAQQDARTADDQKLLGGLRSRMLFDIADRYCIQRLAQADLSPIESESLINERIRTQMARAVQVTGVDRVLAWNTAQQLGNDFLTANSQHKRAVLIRVQMALAQLAEGRLIAAEYRLQNIDEVSRQRGLTQLREARRALENVTHELEQILPRAPTESNVTGSLTNNETHSLLANVRYQLAIANLARATLYPAEDQVNRIDALTGVVEWLRATLPQVDEQHPLNHAARIHLAEAYRYLRDTALANATLDSLDERELDSVNREAFWRERIAMGIETNSPDAVLRWLERIEATPQPEPETWLSAIQVMLFMSHRVADKAEHDRWISTASKSINTLEKLHGVYWSRLAERLLVAVSNTAVTSDSNTNTPSAGSRNIVMRLGETAMRESRWSDALQAFEAAVGDSIAAKQWNEAFSAQLRAAQAAEQLGKFDVAQAGLLKIVQLQPQHASAPAAHLRAAWCAAQLAATDPAQKETFRHLLVKHLRDWPGDDTSPLARLWLARLQLAAGESLAAIDNYMQIPRLSPYSLDAATDLRSAAMQWRAQAQNDPTADAARLSHALVALMTPRDQLPESSVADVYLLQAVAPIAAEFGALDPGELLVRTDATLQIEDATKTDWYGTQVAIDAAFQAELPAAQGHLEDLFNSINRDRVALKWLHQLLTLRNATLKNETIQGWQLKAVTRLAELAESDVERKTWELQSAQILFDNGQMKDASQLLISLARDNPNRSDIQLMYARSLEAINADTVSQLAQWRRVASQQKDHSDPWFEAKYGISRLLAESGKKTEAAQILRFIQTVPPGWNDSKLRKQFESLLMQCTD